MIRATITVICMSIFVVVMGIPVLLLGFIYPSHRVLAALSRAWAAIVLRGAGVHLKIEGREHIADGEPRFYVANHQSAMDIPILIHALRGDVRFFGKDALFRIPIFGWILGRYGFVPVDRTNARRTLRRVEEMLHGLRRRAVSFAVFPEGTRSRDGKLLPFRRGTMKICQRSGLDVVPVAVDGSIRVHHRDHFRATPGDVRLAFHAPIPADEARQLSSTELLERVVGVIAKTLHQDSRSVIATSQFLSNVEAA